QSRHARAGNAWLRSVGNDTLASVAGAATCATRALNVTSDGSCDNHSAAATTTARTDAAAYTANDRLRSGAKRSSRSTLNRSIGVVVDNPGASNGTDERA